MRRMLAALLLPSFVAGCGGSAASLARPQSCTGCTAYELAAVLTPPAGSATMVTEQVTDLHVQADASLPALQLHQPVVFSGRVVWAPGDAESVAALVVLSRSSAVPGLPALTYSTVASAGVKSGGPAFALLVPDLPPGQSYAVSVIPQDPTVAARTPPITFAEPMTASHYTEYTIGGSDKLIQLDGSVTDASGAPVAGASVAVLGAAMNPWDGAVVSTTASTDASGEFTLWFPRALSGGDFTVRIGPSAGGAARPEVYFQRHLDLGLVTGTSAPLGAFTLPPFQEPVAYSFDVGGPGPSGGTIPAASAAVTFRAEGTASASSTWMAWRYVASGTTAADGTITLPLLSGRSGATISYTVTVSTSPDSPLADLSGGSVSIGPSMPLGEPITLSPRPYVIGQVLDSSGAPEGNLVVSVMPSLLDASTPAVRLGSTPAFQGVTQSDGEFSIAVDPLPSATSTGTAVDLDVQPPQGSMLPSWSFDNTKLATTATGAGLMPVQGSAVVLPPGVVVSGEVFDPQGNPAAGVGVRLFEVSPAVNGCTGSTGSCTPPPRLRATATTDAQGTFSVVLADPP